MCVFKYAFLFFIIKGAVSVCIQRCILLFVYFFSEEVNVRSIKHQFNEARFTAQLWTLERRPARSAPLPFFPPWMQGKNITERDLRWSIHLSPCAMFKAVECPHLIVWSVPLRRHISSQVSTQRERRTDHAADFLYNSPALILLRRRQRIALPLWTASVLLLPAVVSICYFFWSGLLDGRCTLTVPKSPLHVLPCRYSCVIKHALWMWKIVTIFSFALTQIKKNYKNQYMTSLLFKYKPFFGSVQIVRCGCFHEHISWCFFFILLWHTSWP